MNRKFGYRPSNGNFNNVDVKPFSQSPIAQSVGGSTNGYIIPENLPCFDQLSLSSCTANAVAIGYAILQYLNDPGSVQYLSRLFLYYNSRMYISETNKDEGSYVHLVLEGLKKLGGCRETDWQYLEGQVYTQPNIISYKEANDNKIDNYYNISSTGQDRVNDIITAINANHPVIFGTSVAQSFINYNGYSDNAFDIPAEPIVGGHAITITGYRTNQYTGKKEFLIKNSWGLYYGTINPTNNRRGYVWVSSDYITWDETNDIFVMTKADNLLV